MRISVTKGITSDSQGMGYVCNFCSTLTQVSILSEMLHLGSMSPLEDQRLEVSVSLSSCLCLKLLTDKRQEELRNVLLLMCRDPMEHPSERTKFQGKHTYSWRHSSHSPASRGQAAVECIKGCGTKQMI